MKILMAVLVLALAFSGFSAASHAMSDTGHIVSSDTQDGSSDINSADSSKDDSKAEKVACPDCLHCCSHVVFQTDNKTQMPEFASSDPVIEATDFLPDALTSSLLRPPKTLA